MRFNEVALKASGSKVVSFAMQGHGAQEDYDFVSEISEVLINEYGFNRLVFLSSYIDCRYTKIKSTNSALPIFHLYAQSVSFQRLTKSAREKGVIIDGVDIPMGGESGIDIFKDFASEIERNIPCSIEGCFAKFSSVAISALRMNNETISDKDINEFYLVAGWAQGFLEKKSDYEAELILKNIVARVRMLDPGNSRSADIANNFSYLLDTSAPADKFIIIGHATHLLPILGSSGFVLKQKLHHNLYTILTTAAFGEITDYINADTYAVKMPNHDSIEYYIVKDALSSAVFYGDDISPYLKSKGRIDLTVRTRNYNRLASLFDLMVLRKQCDALYVSGKISPVQLC